MPYMVTQFDIYGNPQRLWIVRRGGIEYGFSSYSEAFNYWKSHN